MLVSTAAMRFIGFLMCLSLFCCRSKDHPEWKPGQKAPETEPSEAEDDSSAILDEQIGWLDGSCLAIKNDSLAIGTYFAGVSLRDTQGFYRARIIAPAQSPEEC